MPRNRRPRIVDRSTLNLPASRVTVECPGCRKRQGYIWASVGGDYDALWLKDTEVVHRGAGGHVRIRCRRCKRCWESSGAYLGLLAQTHPGQRVHHGMSAVAALYADGHGSSTWEW